MPRSSHRPLVVLARERRRVLALLRTETVGGVLLVVAAAAALVIANSPLAPVYATVRDFHIGPAALHLNLTVQDWTADGLLALFFFLAGLELKREFVAGELREPRRAIVPVAAAIGGMVVPAVIYLLITLGDPTARSGWAIPTATDIAFALAVLAVIGKHLPGTLRTFLLTLAVVDDLLAIIIIAIFYTRDLQPVYLLLALIPLLGFTIAVQRRIGAWWVLAPLGLAAWGLMHASGVHATVAGVLMGFAVPVLPRRRGKGRDGGRSRGGDGANRPTAGESTPSGRDGANRRGGDGSKARARRPRVDLAERFEHRLRPVSAGFAVPLFAFFASGVSIGGLGAALSTRVVIGIVIGMVVGKTLGILLATLLAGRVTRSPLLRELALPDLVGLAILGGVGFTVSLLIGDLAFGEAGERSEHVQIAVLTGSVIAAVVAAAVLSVRNRKYRVDARAATRRRIDAPDPAEPG